MPTTFGGILVAAINSHHVLHNYIYLCSQSSSHHLDEICLGHFYSLSPTPLTMIELRCLRLYQEANSSLQTHHLLCQWMTHEKYKRYIESVWMHFYIIAFRFLFLLDEIFETVQNSLCSGLENSLKGAFERF